MVFVIENRCDSRIVPFIEQLTGAVTETLYEGITNVIAVNNKSDLSKCQR